MNQNATRTVVRSPPPVVRCAVTVIVATPSRQEGDETAPPNVTNARPGASAGRSREDRSAAAAGGAAALADVAGAGRAHLRAAGHAQRRVGGLAQVQLQQLG